MGTAQVRWNAGERVEPEGRGPAPVSPVRRTWSAVLFLALLAAVVAPRVSAVAAELMNRWFGFLLD
jgi:hypothetical protein